MSTIGLSIQAINQRRWTTVGVVSYQDEKITTITDFKKRLNLRLQTDYFNNLLLDNLIRFKAPSKCNNHTGHSNCSHDNGVVFRLQNTELFKHGKIEHMNNSHSIIKLTSGRFQILPTSVLINMADSGIVDIA